MGRKQYPLRLDADLYQAIARWANDELRSVNAHIEFLLRDALKKGGRLPKRDKPPEKSSSGTDEGKN